MNNVMKGIGIACMMILGIFLSLFFLGFMEAAFNYFFFGG